MNKQEKINFINTMINTLQSDIMSKIDKMPDDWNGVELRMYLVEKANNYVWKVDRRIKRYKDYKNDILVKNL